MGIVDKYSLRFLYNFQSFKRNSLPVVHGPFLFKQNMVEVMSFLEWEKVATRFLPGSYPVPTIASVYVVSGRSLCHVGLQYSGRKKFVASSNTQSNSGGHHCFLFFILHSCWVAELPIRVKGGSQNPPPPIYIFQCKLLGPRGLW